MLILRTTLTSGSMNWPFSFLTKSADWMLIMGSTTISLCLMLITGSFTEMVAEMKFTVVLSCHHFAQFWFQLALKSQCQSSHCLLQLQLLKWLGKLVQLYVSSRRAHLTVQVVCLMKFSNNFWQLHCDVLSKKQFDAHWHCSQTDSLQQFNANCDYFFCLQILLNHTIWQWL